MQDETEMDGCGCCSRRTFVQTLLGLAASGALLLPRAPWAETGDAVLPLDKLAGLDRPGAGMRIKLRGREILLIRVSETEISALDPACRHKKCGVKFESGWDKIRCKCHGSRYDLRGQVLNGPAKQDLARYPSEITGGALKIGLP